MLSKAPGKVMIAGEYSVLSGFPAVVAAIDRVATCRFKTGATLKFFSKTTKEFSEIESPLFLAVIITFKKYGLDAKIGNYHLDTSGFFDESGQKMGLGSSAAAITALSHMILLQHGIADQEMLFQRAFEAHRLFSASLGSGADIAASVYGSISYQPSKDSPLIKRLDLSILWPDIMVIHTRKAQSTSPFVEKFLSSQGQKSAIDNFNAAQSACVERLVANLNNIDVFSRSLNELYDLLKSLGKTIAIDIVSEEHRLIAKIARSLQGAAKPSGAGGGDIAIAYVPRDVREEFRRLLERHNFSIVPLSLSAPGRSSCI